MSTTNKIARGYANSYIPSHELSTIFFDEHDGTKHHMLIPIPASLPPLPRAPALESQLGSEEPQGHPGRKKKRNQNALHP